MASARRPSSDHLSFLRGSAERARRFSIFALLRQAEARAPGLPRIGHSRMPQDNVVDLAHSTTLGFPGATLEAIEFGAAGRARVRTCFLGLTGPMGAMPLHLSELAHYESRYSQSRPVGRFLDLLTDRMLQFFYRAWADTQPAADLDRPGEDRFSAYIAALAGIREDRRTKFPVASRLGLANLFVLRRSPAALIDALSNLLGMPVSIEEFIARRRSVVSPGPHPHRRERELQRARPRRDAGRACGGHRRHLSHQAEGVRHGGISPSPSQRRALLRDRGQLDALAPAHLEWQLQLEIDETAIEPARLDGAAALGWSAWVAPRGLARTRGDARLGRKPHPTGNLP